MDIDAQRNNTTLAPKPFEALWFSDGNIVLATDTLLFKVHRGVLSLQSSVFKDMFDFPTGSGPQANENGFGAEQELYEGLPLVNMAGEKGESLACLLRAAYERQYYHRDDINTPLEVVTSLLLMSTKYDFQHIRTDVILQISKHYPTALDEYRDFDDEDSLFGRSRYDCSIPLLSAAFTAEATALLPALFYAASENSTFDLFEELNEGHIKMDCFGTLLEGKELIVSTMHSLVVELPGHLTEVSRAAACETCKAGVPPTNFAEFAYALNLAELKGEDVVQEHFDKLCMECSAECAALINRRRQEIWDLIPIYFGLPAWHVHQEELRRLSEGI